MKGSDILCIGEHLENDILSPQPNNWNTLYYNMNKEKESKNIFLQFSSDVQPYNYVKNRCSPLP